MTPTASAALLFFITFTSFFLAMWVAHFAYTQRFAWMWCCSAAWAAAVLIAVSTLQRLQ